MSRWITILPHDVWMFRDGRPFGAGTSYLARSVFPPTPETLQGALRSAILEYAGVDWEDYAHGNISPELAQHVGVPAEYDHQTLKRAAQPGTYQFRGPWIARVTANGFERYFPAPCDLLEVKSTSADPTPTYLLPQPRQPDFYTDPPAGWDTARHPWYALHPNTAARVANVEDQWITEGEFRRYLQGVAPQFCQESDTLWQIEERPGLGLNRLARTAQQSLYYLARFIRPCEGIGLAEEVEFPGTTTSDPLPGPTGTLALGGEGRMATYQYSAAPDPFPQHLAGKVKIVLLTPAWFSQGWQPRNRDWTPWLGPNAQLVSVALGKPIAISGWDIATGRPKPLYHYLPAGSVWYFKDAEPGSRAFTEIPPDRPDMTNNGYGAFATASWT